MWTRNALIILVAAVATILGSAAFRSDGASAATTPTALTGQVSSQEEGAMEGVLVSVKKQGSTVTTTVVSDAKGRYSFPGAKLEPGRYSLSIRAVGYDLASAADVEITQKAATLDVKLRKAQDLAAQLSNAEWFASMPGTERQKQVFANCVSCHTLERIARSRYTATEFQQVVQRMGTYANSSPPRHPVKRRRGRPGGLPKLEDAEFLSSINLSKVSKWEYPLKTFPRPKGKATRVIMTEYDLPRLHAAPHDVVVDANGMAWYCDFGEQVMGMLNPKTAQVVEYPVPEVKPGWDTGMNNMEIDRDGKLWLALFYQPGVAKFDPGTKKFETWAIPDELTTDGQRVVFVEPENHSADGRVWMGGGMSRIQRVDLKTGQWDAPDEKRDLPKDSPAASRPRGIYDIVSDSKNNLYELDIMSEYIVKVDAKTLKATYYQTPTLDSNPRRGHMDSQDRLWFGEHGANRIGMFDTKTERFQEWVVPSPNSNPYDAVLDKNEEVWSGGMTSDRIVRLNPKTGAMIEYLLPRPTNVRRVYVDNSTTPTTFWVGNNNMASIVRLEPLE